MKNIAIRIRRCSAIESSVILCRKRHLTLFELLLVVAILGLAGAVVMININKSLVYQRFQTEVSQIVGMVELAQDLMLVLNSDVHLKFEKVEEGIRYWIDLETQLPAGIQQEILRPRKVLKTIHGVFFKDSLDYNPVYGEIDLKFLSHGAVMSQGMMRLSTSKEEENPPSNSLHTYICLPGYPYPIAHFDDWEAAEEACGMSKDDSYDDRIAQDTFSRLPASLREAEETEEQDKGPKKPEEGESDPGKDAAAKRNKQTAKPYAD